MSKTLVDQTKAGWWHPQTDTELNPLRAKERRDRIAEGFAFALAASPNAIDFSASDIANHATLFADTLIEELDK